MKRFKSVFRPKSDTSDHSSRHLWQRLSSAKPPETTATETNVSSEGAPDDNVQDPEAELPAEQLPRSKYGTKRLRNMVVNRFRGSQSHEDHPLTDLAQNTQTETPRGNTGDPLSSNPFERPPEYQNPPPGRTVRFDDRVQTARQVSGETSHSQQSQESSQTEDTVRCHLPAGPQPADCQHPPDCPHPPEQQPPEHIRVSLDDESVAWDWPGLMYNPEEGGRVREPSDPFSDGKGSEYRQAGSVPRQGPSPAAPTADPSSAPKPSKRSPYQSREGSSRDGSMASEGPLEPILESDTIEEIPNIDKIVTADVPQHASRHSNPQKSTRRASSASSSSSDKRPPSTLNPPKAIIIFNRMAAQQRVHVRIQPDGSGSLTTSPTSPSPPNSIPPVTEAEGSSRRGFFSRLRKTRSSLETRTEPHAPIHRLRRMKTIANFRPNPLTSMAGKSVETLARLGGQSFLMIRDLGPAPMQLPACMVAAVMFLHRYGPNHPQVFTRCPDPKAAFRTYDGWAEHVLEAEKLPDRIDLTMRVVGMPRIGAHQVPVESVAWALRYLLAGLPYGILGSVRLYQTLRDLFYAAFPDQSALQVPSCLAGVTPSVAIRAQFIALAVIGLSSEMQRDLICAIFGLLDFLLHPESTLEAQRAQETGTDVRDPVVPPDFQQLVVVFAPLLLGQSSRGKLEVEQSVDESRVATLLIEHWHNVNRQLKYWCKDTLIPGRE